MFKVLENGKSPTQESKCSVCLDLYAGEDVVIGAGETEEISLGVCIDMKNIDHEKGILHTYSGCLEIDCYYLQLSLNDDFSIFGLIQPSIQNISLDFKDELSIIIHNPVTSMSSGYYPNNKTKPSFEDFNIKKGDKVAQVILLEHKSHLLV